MNSDKSTDHKDLSLFDLCYSPRCDAIDFDMMSYGNNRGAKMNHIGRNQLWQSGTHSPFSIIPYTVNTIQYTI